MQRDLRVNGFLNDLSADIRYGLRGLLKNKAFSAAVILTMALGIGANTAIFSLINAVLLKSLPVKDPHRLVLLTDPASVGFQQGISTGVRGSFSWSEYRQLHQQNRVFSDFFAAQNGNDDATYAIGTGPQEKGHARLVTGNYFAVLGVKAALGRTFTEDDDSETNPSPATVLSNAFWQRRFGGSRDVLGKTMRVGSANVKVIGVTQPGFLGERVGESADLWLPVQLEPQVQPNGGYLKAKELHWLASMGRLKPGFSRARAQAAINISFQQILQSEAPPKMSPEELRMFLDQRIQLLDGEHGISPLRARVSDPLFVLMIAVGLVLLIACANVANLLLARATGRTKEISIRLALGAASGRLFRQLLTESMLYGILGGALSLWLASWGSQALLLLASDADAPIILLNDLDWRVLSFTLTISLFTGLLFGAVPAFAARKVDVAPALQRTARGVMEGGSSAFTFRNALVTTQVAFSMLLLIVAGLFVRTLQNLSRADLGYTREHLLIANLDFGVAGYKDAGLVNVYRRIFERLNATPGVSAATYSMNGLFNGSYAGDQFTVEGYHPGRNYAHARFEEVGPNYFRTIGMPLLSGRGIATFDNELTPKIAVVNQAFVKKFLGGGEALGKWVRDEYPGGSRPIFTIVGVVADAKDQSLRDKVEPMIFTPVVNGIVAHTPDSTTIEMRTTGNASTMKTVIEKAVGSIDAGIPVTEIRTLDEQVDRQLGTEKLIAQLCSSFGALALLLAAVGLYGVVAYSVARRTAEMGVRLALGASGNSLIWLVMRETFSLVIAGFAIGISLALALTRLIGNRLYGVVPDDPLTLTVAVLALALASGVAGLIPAVRAARIDPVIALRWE